MKQILDNKPRVINHLSPPSVCVCCGSSSILYEPILWDALINSWELAGEEADYINRQQGIRCKRCKSNLRTMAIANAMMREAGYTGYFIDFIKSRQFKTKRILEINEAGQMHQFLKILPDLTLGEYPEVDIQALPYPNNTFDIVVHSDTLEHVPDPLKALTECRRVIKEDGYCLFTVPIVIGRLSKSRVGLPPSFHGSAQECGSDYLVQTEFGADVWQLAMQAGFSRVTIDSLEYPAAQSILCRK